MKKHDPFPSEGNAGLVVAAAVDTLWILMGSEEQHFGVSLQK